MAKRAMTSRSKLSTSRLAKRSLRCPAVVPGVTMTEMVLSLRDWMKAKGSSSADCAAAGAAPARMRAAARPVMAAVTVLAVVSMISSRWSVVFVVFVVSAGNTNRAGRGGK